MNKIYLEVQYINSLEEKGISVSFNNKVYKGNLSYILENILKKYFPIHSISEKAMDYNLYELFFILDKNTLRYKVKFKNNDVINIEIKPNNNFRGNTFDLFDFVCDIILQAYKQLKNYKDNYTYEKTTLSKIIILE